MLYSLNRLKKFKVGIGYSSKPIGKLFTGFVMNCGCYVIPNYFYRIDQRGAIVNKAPGSISGIISAGQMKYPKVPNTMALSFVGTSPAINV